MRRLLGSVVEVFVECSCYIHSIRCSVGELDEDTIRSRIIIDRASTSVPEGRQMFRREGTDGLKLDKTDSQCENTVQEIEIRTDSIGKQRS